jgi:hypothetical protein
MLFEKGTVLVSKQATNIFLGLDGRLLGELAPGTRMLFVGYEHSRFLRYVKVLLGDGRLGLVLGNYLLPL